MESINWVETGGQFGRTRALPTFTLHTQANGRIMVTDDTQKGRLVGCGFATVEDAIKIFKPKSDSRVTMWAR